MNAQRFNRGAESAEPLKMPWGCDQKRLVQ